MIQQHFNSLLKEFSEIQETTKNDITFLELSGYPHYENVCSNILSFFLDPEREHGLSYLVCNALLKCINFEEQLSNIIIEREVATDNGRIDLVIYSDSHVIAIENKIFHSPENPFQDYKNKISSIAHGRSKVYILLGLKKETIHLHGFQSITYTEFFNNIRTEIGNHIEASNNKYLVFLVEFIKSIENIISGGSMNKELIDFFSHHEKEAISFVKSFNDIRSELRSKISQVKNLLVIKETKKIVKQGLYREPNTLFDCLYTDIRLDGQSIAIDCIINTSGWEITIFLRPGGTKELLKKSLESRNINVRDGERFQYAERIPFNESFESVAETLSKLINQLNE